MTDKWLKAGAVEDGPLRRTTEGSPQGGVIPPCLSNVFLYHVLDEWFETEVKPRLRGECTLVRYADDALMAFDNIVDARRVLSVLGKRLARYGLTLHPDKTRLVDFRPKRTEGAPSGFAFFRATACAERVIPLDPASACDGPAPAQDRAR
jgi:RNA-directed DNA polymerase